MAANFGLCRVRDKGGRSPTEVANLAADASPPLLCLIQKDLSLDDAERKKGKEPSVWVILAQSPEDLGPLARTRWQVARTRPELRVWTDDFSDLVSVLRF